MNYINYQEEPPKEPEGAPEGGAPEGGEPEEGEPQA